MEELHYFVSMGYRIYKNPDDFNAYYVDKPTENADETPNSSENTNGESTENNSGSAANNTDDGSDEFLDPGHIEFVDDLNDSFIEVGDASSLTDSDDREDSELYLPDLPDETSPVIEVHDDPQMPPADNPRKSNYF